MARPIPPATPTPTPTPTPEPGEGLLGIARAALVRDRANLIFPESRRVECEAETAVDLRIEESRCNPGTRTLARLLQSCNAARLDGNRDQLSGGIVPRVNHHSVIMKCCSRFARANCTDWAGTHAGLAGLPGQPSGGRHRQLDLRKCLSDAIVQRVSTVFEEKMKAAGIDKSGKLSPAGAQG